MNAILNQAPGQPRARKPAGRRSGTGIRKRCAIVECYSRHDEVYLTLVHLLEELGYEVHLFTEWRNRLRNSFVHARQLKPRLHIRWNATRVLEAVGRERFDFVVMNTFEGPLVLECVRRLLEHTPVLGFIHNGSLIRNLPEYQSLLAHPRLKVMTLADYVAEDLAGQVDAGTVVPVHFFDREVPRIPRRLGRRRFCAQGYFDPKRRDYGQLLEAIRTLRAEGRQDFEVYIMGRSLGRSFRTFARQVRDAGLSDHVHYSWKGIGYRTYYRLLSSMDFLLPLIRPESHPTYFRSESTSSIAAAVGFNAVPVAHEQLARAYRIQDIAITYQVDLLGAMRSALIESDEDLARRRTRLAGAKLRLLDDSRRELADAITTVSRCS